LTTQCFTASLPLCQVVGHVNDQVLHIQDTEAFLEKQTAFDRDSKPVLARDLPAGISNIYISRISILGSRQRGLVFTAR
jgi:hypothetical protein